MCVTTKSKTVLVFCIRRTVDRSKADFHIILARILLDKAALLAGDGEAVARNTGFHHGRNSRIGRTVVDRVLRYNLGHDRLGQNVVLVFNSALIVTFSLQVGHIFARLCTA